MNTVVLSKISPVRADAGAKLAIASDLRVLRQLGHEITLIACRHSNEETGSAEDADRVVFYDARPGALWRRSLRALASGLPAAVERYYAPATAALIESTLLRIRPDLVIVEEAALAAWIPLVRRMAPRARVVLRSHDYIQDASEGVRSSLRGIRKALYAQEARRARNLEIRGVIDADAVWAITELDRASYDGQFPGVRVACVPVAVATERLESVPDEASEPDSLLHIGTIDTKKAPGMRRFLSAVWPVLRAANPRAKFYVAGRNTARLPIEGAGVVQVGYVEDDAPWYARARYVVNTQSIPSGVTLKTLMCFAAGRTLLSDRAGVHGLAVNAGEHFWELDRLATVAGAREFWDSEGKSRRMAARGREWVRRRHSFETVATAVTEALDLVCQKEPLLCAE
jgi:hypothetical protein